MRRSLIIGGTAAGLLLGPVGLALAAGHWSSPIGSGTALAADYTLTAPSSFSATESSATDVHLTWTAPVDHSLTGFSYVLTRTGGTGSMAGTCAVLTAATVACDDTGTLTIGQQYTYTLKGQIGNWTGPEVSAGPITDLGPAATVTAVTGTTPQSAAMSAAFGTNLAATVKDSAGDLLPGVSVTFTADSATNGATGTFASGCTSGSGSTCTVLADSSGVATASTFTANARVGSYTVTATSGSASSASFALSNTGGGGGGGGPSFTVSGLSTANGSGTPSTLDSGDTVTVSFSAAPKSSTVCTSWDGSSKSITLNLTAGSHTANSAITVTAASNCPGWGSLDLGNNGFVTQDGTATATILESGSTVKITLTTSPNHAAAQPNGSYKLTYTPGAVTDPSGNAVTGTATEPVSNSVSAF